LFIILISSSVSSYNLYTSLSISVCCAEISALVSVSLTLSISFTSVSVFVAISLFF